MQRIDGTTAAAALPAPGAVSGTPGYFTDGNPATGTPATTMSPDWANMIQEEMLAPVLAAGLEPSKSDHGQLLAALHVLFVAAGGSSGVIVGEGEATIPLPGGFYLKVGSIVGSFIEQTLSHTFDNPFPTKCWAVIPVSINGSAQSGRDVWPQRVSLAVEGFTLFLNRSGGTSNSDSSDGVDFIAIGN